MSIFTTAGPSIMYLEHFHAIISSIAYQFKRAMNSLIKLVNLASRDQLSSFVAPICGSATITALKKRRKPASDLLLWVKSSGASLPNALQKTLDLKSVHALSCHGRDDMISRHNCIRDKVISACSGTLLSPICDQKRLLLINIAKLAEFSCLHGMPVNQQHWKLPSILPYSQASL